MGWSCHADQDQGLSCTCIWTGTAHFLFTPGALYSPQGFSQAWVWPDACEVFRPIHTVPTDDTITRLKYFSDFTTQQTLSQRSVGETSADLPQRLSPEAGICQCSDLSFRAHCVTPLLLLNGGWEVCVLHLYTSRTTAISIQLFVWVFLSQFKPQSSTKLFLLGSWTIAVTQ